MSDKIILSKWGKEGTDIALKRVQRASKVSESSGIFYSQSRQDLEKIFDYLYLSGVQ